MKKLLGFKSGSSSCQQRMGWKTAWPRTARPAKAGGMAVLEHRPAFPGCCLSSVSSNPREPRESWQISAPSLSSAGMYQKKGGGVGRENHWRAKSCFNPTNKNTVQCTVTGPHKTPCVGDATPARQLSGIGYSSL